MSQARETAESIRQMANGQGKKIQAIKNLRDSGLAAGMGLKDAKDIVEVLMGTYVLVNPAQRDSVENELRRQLEEVRADSRARIENFKERLVEAEGNLTATKEDLKDYKRRANEDQAFIEQQGESLRTLRADNAHLMNQLYDANERIQKLEKLIVDALLRKEETKD